MIGMGNSQGVAVAQPPYIRFETRAIKRMAPAEQGGAVYFVDVDYALVTSHGSKDTVEKALPDWFEHLKMEVHQNRLPANWFEAYQASYRAWKAGEELPVVGTPLKNWPVLSPAEAKNLNELGLRAVEDLAAANEELVGRIGMGARSLVQRARDWIAANKDQAPLIQQLDAQRNVIAGMELQLSELRQMVAAMGPRQQAQEPPQHAVMLAPLENRLDEARAAAATVSEDDLIADAIEDA